MPHLTADLVFWITERYAIKMRREIGLPKPWSADPIFQSVRFCNVHREDDTVTKWIRENWNKPTHAAWIFVLARMLNYVPTLESILEYSDLVQEGDWPLDGIREGLKATREAGEKVFTSAYTISTCGKSMDKINYVCDWVCQRTKDKEEAGGNEFMYQDCDRTWSWLTQVDGLGSFLAAQVVADMKNTKGHPLADAADFWSFSKPGPGSLRGLSWYFFETDKGVTPTTYDTFMLRCRDEVDPLIPSYIPRISDQDFQNCLCEISKYMKMKRDPFAHVRNKYHGT